MINLNLKKKKCLVQLGCTVLLAAGAGTVSAALENESNDIFADASFATPGTNSGVIGDLSHFATNDADFWRFDLTAGSEFTAELSDGPAADAASGFDVQAIIVLYLENNGSYYAVAGNRSSPGSASTDITFTPWDSGTYFLTVSGNGNAPQSFYNFLQEDSSVHLNESTPLSLFFEFDHFQGNGFVSFDYNLDLTGAVAATPSAVPVPAAAWLFGTGLLGLIGVARRKS